MHGDHGLALVLQRLQDIDDGAFRGGVDAGERLVQQVEIRVLRQRPGEEHALLLAARQLADLAVREIRHADAVEAGLRARGPWRRDSRPNRPVVR
jgi:hypothetical protein